jgi:hypothetical protein
MILRSNTTYSAFAVIIILLASAIGCHGEKKATPAQYTPDSQASREYEAALEAWTREDRIYQGFDCRLIATATLKSVQFRRAYTEAYGVLYRLTEAEKEKFLNDQIDAAETYIEVFLAIYVPDKSWDDFSKKKSIWKLRLIQGEDNRVEPVEIRNLKRNDVVLKHFFPYVTPWKSLYLLRFPIRNPETGKALMGSSVDRLTLWVSSVLGSVEMSWSLKQD